MGAIPLFVVWLDESCRDCRLLLPFLSGLRGSLNPSLLCGRMWSWSITVRHQRRTPRRSATLTTSVKLSARRSETTLASSSWQSTSTNFTMWRNASSVRTGNFLCTSIGGCCNQCIKQSVVYFRFVHIEVIVHTHTHTLTQISAFKWSQTPSAPLPQSPPPPFPFFLLLTVEMKALDCGLMVFRAGPHLICWCILGALRQVCQLPTMFVWVLSVFLSPSFCCSGDTTQA